MALSVLEAMLQPHRSRDALTLLLHHEAISSEVDGDRVRTVTLRDRRDGTERTVCAPYVLDATETGALLPLTGTEYVTGAESRADTGEPPAPCSTGCRPRPRGPTAEPAGRTSLLAVI